MVNGVMNVFDGAGADLEQKPLFGPTHKLEEFLRDQNLLFALIADGPLWVL